MLQGIRDLPCLSQEVRCVLPCSRSWYRSGSWNHSRCRHFDRFNWSLCVNVYHRNSLQGENPTSYKSGYNPIYSWCLGPRVLPSRPLVDSHCVPPGSKQKGKNTSSEEVPRGFLRLLYRGQLSYPFWGNQRILVQMYG